jgi:hypothetical protein
MIRQESPCTRWKDGFGRRVPTSGRYKGRATRCKSNGLVGIPFAVMVRSRGNVGLLVNGKTRITIYVGTECLGEIGHHAGRCQREAG